MIRLEDITLSVGGRELISGAIWHVRPGDRVGLVGRNGTGKTTLLRAMVGEFEVESGKVHRRGGLALGYLPQQAVSGSTAPLWDEVRSRMDRLNRLAADLETAEAALAGGDPATIDRHAEVQEAFRLAGGYAIDERIGGVLHGLGFRREDWFRPCDRFSGGWQMRIALARLLLGEPDLLLLDEPTNHLDLLARGWLAGFLAEWRGALVVVSHDRHLLDTACNRIVEVRFGRLHAFTGNMAAWLAERGQREVRALSEYDTQQEEIARLERFVDRFRYKASKAGQAQERLKRLDKMVRLDAPEREAAPRLRLPDAPPSSMEAVSLVGATVAWPDGPQILTGVDLVVERGVRLAVLGPNGCGKSTLLRALSGDLPPRPGRRHVGKGTRLGLFSQDLAQELPAGLSALEHVREVAPAASDQQIRTALGALGLSGDAALRPIGALSGGEKARVALAAFVVKPRNVLLLDEPTNHLDVVTVEVLVQALLSWEGALVMVTHDRHLVEAVATHVVQVRDGAILLTEGVAPEDFTLPPLQREREQRRDAAEGHAARKRSLREREALVRRVEAISAELEGAEATLSRVDTDLVDAGADHHRLRSLAVERAEVEARIEALFAEWQQAEAALAAD